MVVLSLFFQASKTKAEKGVCSRRLGGRYLNLG